MSNAQPDSSHDEQTTTETSYEGVTEISAEEGALIVTIHGAADLPEGSRVTLTVEIGRRREPGMSYSDYVKQMQAKV